MNVCLLIDAWEPIWGGGQTHVWEISQRLVTKFGCTVTIYTRALKSKNGIIYNKNQSLLNGRLTVIRSGTPADFFQPWSRIAWIFQIIQKVISDQRKKTFFNNLRSCIFCRNSGQNFKFTHPGASSFYRARK